MKTLGQIAFEAYSPELAQHAHWEDVAQDKTAKRWEAAAQAVRAAVIEQCRQLVRNEALEEAAARIEYGHYPWGSENSFKYHIQADWTRALQARIRAFKT